MNLDINHYLAILKGKKGEFDALRKLEPDAFEHFTPLIDVVRIPLATREKTTLEQHLDKTARNISESCGGKTQIFVDLFDIDADDRMLSGEHPVAYIFKRLAAESVNALPTVGLDRDKAYIAAASAAAVTAKGVVFRLLPEDLEIAGTLDTEVVRLARTVGLPVQDAHLLLDLRSVRDHDEQHYVGLVARAIRAVSNIGSFASLVVAGSSVPQSLAEEMGTDSLARLQRKELKIWRGLQLLSGMPRRPSFGDYGVVHPDQLDLDPRRITLSASIRYTTGNDLLLVRGKSFKKHPEGWKQYHGLASILVKMPDYRGAAFSWGDQKLRACAREVGGPGNKTTWVSICTNHHIATVLDQLRPVSSMAPRLASSE